MLVSPPGFLKLILEFFLLGGILDSGSIANSLYCFGSFTVNDSLIINFEGESMETVMKIIIMA